MVFEIENCLWKSDSGGFFVWSKSDKKNNMPRIYTWDPLIMNLNVKKYTSGLLL